jgi:hypothetical protein
MQTFFGFICPRCGSTIDIGVGRPECPNCGVAMVPNAAGNASATNVYCPKCKLAVGLANSERCPKCGGAWHPLP